MSVNGPLKQVFEEAMREVTEWPAWMRSREIEGSASQTLLSTAEQRTPNSGYQEPQGEEKS
jgi:hypothetical protein